MSDITAKLSVREKVGYGVGDAAANFIFQTIIVFQLAFYTDTFGLSAAAVGVLFLVVRFSDAITDPIMGLIADRTNTKWGKFRPWILWSAIPFGILAFLTFSTPDFSPTGKLVYAYVTYTLLMVVYTINNLPYSALSGVMTADQAERTSLSSYRFVFAMLAAFLIQTFALPLVNFFGKGNDALGYKITLGLFSALAAVLFVVTFFSTKERVQPDPGQKTSIKQDLLDLVSNRPWIAMFFLTLFLFITLALRGGVMFFYFSYFLDANALRSFMEGLPSVLDFFVRLSGGRPVAVVFSLFNAFGLISTILAIALSKPLAIRYGKRNVFFTGVVITAIFSGAFYFIPNDKIGVAFVTEALRQFAYGVTIPLLWAMMADVADYSEWKNHRRATGIVFSAVVFGLKAGLGLGGAIGGGILAIYGYVPNAEQTAHALTGIVLTASIFPAITFLISASFLFLYNIDLKTELLMTRELADRKAGLPSTVNVAS
ncbi:MAG: MFS transporter [Bacteroidetes bacterium]|nr:MFS transporter [Bacteroidota bacterium]